MNLLPVLLLCGLVVFVAVVVGVLAYRTGIKNGQAERCERHWHAEDVALSVRDTLPQHDGPSAYVSDADFRHTLLDEGDEREGFAEFG